jgi:polysaccharide transporter, PST family
LVRHALVQNTIALSAAQVGTYLFPLVTIPYLARVLGVAGWGLVAFAQAFGAYIGLGVEYGFSYSATREIARHRNDREKLAEITAGVLGAKVLLATVAIAVAISARWYVPIFHDRPDLLWAGTFCALAQAFSMLWFFQGLERMKLVASLDFFAKALATMGIFILVKIPTDGWKVLALQGAGAGVSFVIGLVAAYAHVQFRMPRWRSVWNALRTGWSMFLFRGSVSMYTVGNAFILGLFVPPQFVGYYAGAEKISKAFVSLLNPVTQTLFPRLSHLIHSARERAAQLARISLAVMGSGGLGMGILIFVLAPQIVRLILGSAYGPAVPVLRILAFLPPLIAVSNVFGIQWMLPLGMDRPFNTIIVIAGVINLGLAVALAPILKAEGMAWAVVVAEVFVALAMYFLLRHRRLDPESYALRATSQSA